MATQIIEMVGPEPRRRFSDDDKARIVSEAMMPGASVLDVARRRRVCTSLVYRWRRTLLRGIAVGRKKWLFAGSDQGGPRAASIYSLVETARLKGVDPEAWLADIIRRVAELLPWNYRPT